jgi:hypothetical protein
MGSVVSALILNVGVGKSVRSTMLPFRSSMTSVLFCVYTKKNVMFGGFDVGCNVIGGNVGADAGFDGTVLYTI